MLFQNQIRKLISSSNVSLFYIPANRGKKALGDYSNGEPPLTIPNREVKPVSADGTASSGRVGRRQSLLKPRTLLIGAFFILFICAKTFVYLCFYFWSFLHLLIHSKNQILRLLSLHFHSIEVPMNLLPFRSILP